MRLAPLERGAHVHCFLHVSVKHVQSCECEAHGWESSLKTHTDCWSLDLELLSLWKWEKLISAVCKPSSLMVLCYVDWNSYLQFLSQVHLTSHAFFCPSNCFCFSSFLSPEWLWPELPDGFVLTNSKDTSESFLEPLSLFHTQFPIFKGQLFSLGFSFFPALVLLHAVPFSVVSLLRFQRLKCTMEGKYGSKNKTLRDHTFNHTEKVESQGSKFSTPTLSDILPPAGLHLRRSHNLPSPEPPTGDQVLRYLSLWGVFSFPTL